MIAKKPFDSEEIADNASHRRLDRTASCPAERPELPPARGPKPNLRRLAGRVATGLMLTVCVLGLGFILTPVFADNPASPSPGLLLAEVTRGNLEQLVSSTGTLTAVGTVEVGTQVSGVLHKLHADYNQRVHKGQLLAEVDRSLYQADVTDRLATLAKARAELKKAQAEYQRFLPLAEKGHITPQELLSQETTVALAKASVSSAEASLKRAQVNLDYTVIRSPIDGTVIERAVEQGQTVAASFSAPKLFVIAEDLSRMQIEANVDESDIGQVRQGQEARFTVQAYPDETFSGQVSQIRLNPITISNVVNYTVVVDAPNPSGRLLPGMTATVDFVVQRADNALLVSNAALRFRLEEEKAGTTKTGTASQTTESGASSPKQGLLHYQDKQGVIHAARVTTGPSDGFVTVIDASSDIREGSQVITGIDSAQATTKGRGGFMSLLPKPPSPPPGAPRPF